MSVDTVKERPILFSAPMVRAILDGTKTQTRRVVKFPLKDRDFGCTLSGNEIGAVEANRLCPYGVPGDRLWVRETFTLETCVEGESPPFSDGRPIKHRPVDDYDGECPLWTQPHYKATDEPPTLTCESERCRVCETQDFGPHWKPSIHMPRWVSRISLEVTGVRVERLQSISQADCVAEGMPEQTNGFVHHVVADYRKLWSEINGTDSWAANPWVWVIAFKLLTPTNLPTCSA